MNKFLAQSHSSFSGGMCIVHYFEARYPALVGLYRADTLVMCFKNHKRQNHRASEVQESTDKDKIL